jgi:hypothetical protein
MSKFIDTFFAIQSNFQYKSITRNKMIASFDIGEKNFAYSIGTRDFLHKWKHYNVMKKKTQTIIESCIAISKILDAEDWSKCKFVIIEQQMRTNIRAQRLAQHLWTWFFTKQPNLIIKFVPSSLKTQFFLGKNNLTSYQRKKWAVTKTLSILKERNDEKNLHYFDTLEKKDDISDTFLQLIAFAS